MNLKALYQKRFEDIKNGKKNGIRIEIVKFLNKFSNFTILSEDIAVDVAAGYCEFINNFSLGHRFAYDLNHVGLKRKK